MGKTPYVRGFLRIVILLLHNFIEIIFWFALFYRNLTWAFVTPNINLNSFLHSLNFSFYNMTTFGHTLIFPKTNLGYVITFIQAGIGIFMSLIVVSRFISLLPPPKTIDEYEI